MKIFITGMMGSGKSTIGKQLANILNYTFTDLDDMIVNQENKSISEIFSQQGEDIFRNIESNIVEKLPQSNQVVATGGGFPLRKQNRDFMKKHGVSIFLETSAETLFKRIHKETHRPVIKTMDIETIQTILNERTLVYKTADYYISTDEKSVESICNEIQEIIKPLNE